MKTLQKRLYNVLPATARVGSRSLNTLAFLDTPPTSPRPSNVLTATRLSVEARGEVESGQNVNLPFSLALTAPSSASSISGQHAFYNSLTASTSKSLSHQSSSSTAKPKSQRFQLDIAAYGIPKRRQYLTAKQSDPLNLAVQVGEDAYFIRENAMGVADGVGGWNKVKCPLPHSQTPSGLFARRLMHHCASELASLPKTMPISPPPSIFRNLNTPSWWSDPPDPLQEAEAEAELQDHLDELEEGIDVLMILERAYQTTLKEHVVPPPPPPKTDTLSGTPLLAGSSTALLAVLDHVPKREEQPSTDAKYEAVVKIAHIGDCMGMLVRGDEIVWRSEEMWWSFNTPVQLSALPSSASPWSSAHTFTLPVQADDVLILASDGLSDNLWDEDILDEVVRFRHGYLSSSPNDESTAAARVRWRQALAGMLSEALCSRARRVSERRQTSSEKVEEEDEDEVPFARRARENGRVFRGGKHDGKSCLCFIHNKLIHL